MKPLPHNVYQARFSLYNNGPGDAANIRLRYSLLKNTIVRQHYLEAEGVQPKMADILKEMNQPRLKGDELPKECSAIGNDITCTIDRLKPQSYANVLIEFQPTVKGADHFWLTAESDTPDPNPENNEFLMPVAME